jgi:branched-chain amino acid aminotransferase
MIHRHLVQNGRVLPLEQVRLSPGQAGLMSGWGIFTTLRIFHGVAFAYERHWIRLQKDASRIRLPFPFEADRVREQLSELVSANQVAEGTARIYAIYNKFGLWQSDEPAPPADLLLCTADLPPHHEPSRLDLQEHGRHAASPLAGVKVTSWLNNVWSLAETQARGYNEVVLLNERGEVAECTAANVFCVREGKVLTPPLNSGCLEGVTRSVLLEIGPKLGVPVVETTLRPEDLFAAEEVFITSTNRSLLGISEVAGHTFSAAPGPVTQRLERAFRNYMEEYVAERAPAK